MQVHAACSSPGIAVDGGVTAEPLGLGLDLSVSSTVRAPLKRLRRAAEPDGAPSASHELSEAADQAEEPVEKVGEAHGGLECCREAGCGRPGLSVLRFNFSSLSIVLLPGILGKGKRALHTVLVSHTPASTVIW